MISLASTTIPTAQTGGGYRNHHELHRSVFCLGSFGCVREGLLKRSFDDSMKRSDSNAHSRYRATGGASLNSLDDSIA